MLWVKAFHIIFVVMWFAGLFYLPRLFVYHADSHDQISIDRFKIMEKKLFIIMTIGAVGSLLFGVWMLFAYALSSYSQQWFLHIKLLLVLALFAYHAYCWHLVKLFARDENTRSHKFYRLINEVPALALFAIVILVVVKPF